MDGEFEMTGPTGINALFRVRLSRKCKELLDVADDAKSLASSSLKITSSS